MLNQTKQLLTLIAEVQILIFINQCGSLGKIDEMKNIIKRLRDRLQEIGEV